MQFLGGFLMCGALLAMLMIGGVMLASEARIAMEPLKAAAVFFGCVALTGPACSSVVWVSLRERNRPFASGAVAFGLSSLLLASGCVAIIVTFHF